MKSDVQSSHKVDRRSTSRSPVKSLVLEVEADDRRQSSPRNDVLVQGSPGWHDHGDVIDARKRRPSTSLAATDVIDEYDLDDDADETDVDGKKRKKTRTVFSRHQVMINNNLLII